MSEIYKEKEWNTRKIMEETPNIPYVFEEYVNEVDDYIDRLTKDLIKEKEKNGKAIEYINEMTLTSDGYANYGDDLRPEHIIDILKGEK